MFTLLDGKTILLRSFENNKLLFPSGKPFLDTSLLISLKTIQGSIWKRSHNFLIIL